MKSTQALTVLIQEQTSIAERSVRAVSPTVREGIHDILVACPPHPGEDGVDRVRLARIWARETAEFEPEIVTEALHNLLIDNPRNPFRPSVEDIVKRCRSIRRQWGDRITRYYRAQSDAVSSAWGENLTAAVLRAELERLSRDKHPCPFPGVSDIELRGLRIANLIGSRITEWPPDLLADFGVPSGNERDRIQAIVDAENERREREWKARRDREAADRHEADRKARLWKEARTAALARPDVKAALAEKIAAQQVNPRSSSARRAHDAFADLYRPAMGEELKARGLQL